MYSHTIFTTFESIYNNNTWQDPESVSGPGSSLRATVKLRQELSKLFDEYAITSLVDAPCGDYNWFKELDHNLKAYYGIDIVGMLIARNQAYANATTKFNMADFIHDELPKADAILCRDGLVHLPNDYVQKALYNFKRSKSKYLIATTFPEAVNTDCVLGAWRPLNMSAAPFNLGKPLKVVEEWDRSYPELGVKCLGVWSLQDLRFT